MNDLACLDDGEEPPAGQCPRRLVAHLIAERRASDFDELVPTPRENAAHAGRAAGRDHKILVEIIVVLARPVQLGGDVGIALGKRQAAIRYDRVPIRHDVGLGHHRKGVKVGLGERLRIDAAQPAGVPGGMRLGVKQGLAQCALALCPDLLRGPGETPDMRRHPGRDCREMLSSLWAVDDHGLKLIPLASPRRNPGSSFSFAPPARAGYRRSPV